MDEHEAKRLGALEVLKARQRATDPLAACQQKHTDQVLASLREEAERKRVLEETSRRPVIEKPTGCTNEPHELGRIKSIEIKPVPVGARFQARFLGPIVTALYHWVGQSLLCMGKGCTHCPGQRVNAGHAPVLIAEKEPDTGEVRLYRHVLPLSNSAIQELEGRELRGCLVQFFRRTKKSAYRVEVIETEAAYVLPETFDVRAYLVSRWRLPYWPDQEAEPVNNPQILKFKREVS